MFTSLLKDMIEDTGQWPDEKISQVQARDGPEHRSSILMELGRITLLVWMCLPAWKLSDTCIIRI